MRRHLTEWRIVTALAWLASLWSCHDASRLNPLDPELTPSVTVQASSDDSVGTAALAWTAYEGESSFAEYWVLRNIQGYADVDTLARIAAIDQVSYLDTELIVDSTYVYRVSILTVDGYEAWSPDCVVTPLTLPTVEITSATFDSRSATASLTWSPYGGPRFARYEVWRSDGVYTSKAATIVDRADTGYVDSHLLGNTPYSYWVTVVTTRNEEARSNRVTGAIHPLLAEWPLPVEGDGTQVDYVRLYAEPDGRIAALIVGSHSVRLLVMDAADGSVIEDRRLLELPFAASRRSVASTLGPEGTRYLTLGQLVPGVIALNPDGSLAFTEHRPFAELRVPDDARVAGQIELVSPEGETGAFRNVWVYSGGEAVFSDDLSDLPDDWFLDESLGGWQFSGYFRRRGGWLQGAGSTLSTATRGDSGWRDFRLEAEVITADNREGEAGIQIGGPTGSRIYLGLNALNQQARLWQMTPEGNSGGDEATTDLVAPLQIIDRAPYRLSLEVSGGLVTARVLSPVHFAQSFQSLGLDKSSYTWSGLAALHGGLALTVDNLSFAIDDAGSGDRQWTSWEAWSEVASSIRVWQPHGEGEPMLGVSLPEDDRIRVEKVFVSRPGSWVCCSDEWGPRFGSGTRNFYYPLVAQGGEDGRVYVLDAGNHRILVLRGKEYVTEWGRYGRGPGQFDFGDDRAIEGASTTAAACAWMSPGTCTLPTCTTGGC